MHVEFEHELDGYGKVHVEAEVTLPRPARMVADHDAAGFADDGDGATVHILAVRDRDDRDYLGMLSKIGPLTARAIEVAADKARDAKGF